MGRNGKKKANHSVLANHDDIEDIVLNIQNAIDRSMHRQKDSARMFICRHDLAQIWKASPPIKRIFPNFDTEECELVMAEYICVLSILIYIGWSDWSLFRPNFLRAERKDADLPFKDTSFLKTFARMFSSSQHAFTPVVIEKHREPHIQSVRPELYLPFIEEPDLMGKGGYGSVTKRVIAPRCLKDKEGKTYNSEPISVACKVYKSPTPFRDFNQELGNLDYIKESLTESSGVMQHIAAIVHGNEFMIISPLAELRDLEIFLRGGYQPDPGTDNLKRVYDFDIEFPLLNTPDKLQHAVVKEAHRLASALKWLHEDLTIFGSSDRYLAHLDLKPANVLVVGDPRGDIQSPAGIWKLSDFGVSSFNKATNAKDPAMPSIRDLGLQLTSRGLSERNLRGRGSYQPPEVDFEDVDSRKCDVWSFGCVLCDILAFTIGKTKAMYKLRNSRYKDYHDDYFYEMFTHTGKEINDSNTKLKSSIVDWWVSLENPSSSSWINDYIKVLRKALKTRPSDRCDIRVTAQGLSELGPSIISQSNETLIPSINPRANETLVPGIRRPSIMITSDDSSTHGETRSLQDTAIGNGYQDVSSQNLSTNSTWQRKRVSIAVQNEDSGQSFSSTESQEASVVPTVPEPEREVISASISALREQSRLSIPLPKKGTVRAVEIAPSTLQVAVLCQHSVHIYSTTNGREVTRYETLPLNVDWKKIRLAAQYFAVYGLGRSNEKHIKIFNSMTKSEEAVIVDNGEQVQDILLSDEKVFAYIYGRSVKLYFAHSKKKTTVRFDKDNAFIIQAKFSASGKILCLWAMGTKADHAYFVRVDATLASGSLCGEGTYQKTIVNSQVRDIWPYLDSQACIIREAHGGTFIAQPSIHSNSGPQERESIGISNALTACVVREDLLVCIKSKMLRAGRLLSGLALSHEPGELRRIVDQAQELGDADKCIEKSTAAAACLIDGKSELVLCTITGKILRYVQS